MQKVLKWIFRILTSEKKRTWKDAEYFDEIWKNRIQQMANFIPGNSSVLDLGCGREWLKLMIPEDVTYYGCDYIYRSKDTIVCDFNKKEFPQINVDVSFVSGCLEYVVDYEWFIKSISLKSHLCIISYCTTDFFPVKEERLKRNWVNDLSKTNLTRLFETYGFHLINEQVTQSSNQIFVFRK